MLHVIKINDVQRFPESAGESDIFVYIHLDSAFNLNLSKSHTVVPFHSLCAQLPGLWVKERLELTMFW